MRRERLRRRLSLTPLVDVIFLLLLFFMLTSTFSRFAEVELAVGGTGVAGTPEPRVLFLRLTEAGLSLNGRAVEIGALEGALDGETARVLVSVTGGATAQALTDVLVVLRRLPALDVAVLGGA